MDKELYYDFPPLSKNDWENRIKQDLKGKDYNKTLMWELEEELLVRPLLSRRRFARYSSCPKPLQ